MKRKKSILIVDDEFFLGELLTDILSPIYEEVVYIQKPEEALAKVSERSFSLIISDVNMPKMPGTELLRLIRMNGRLDLVMFLTGQASKEIVLHALRLGAVDVLEKPIEPDDLVQAIDRAFDMERRRQLLYLERAKNEAPEEKIRRQAKILGLMHVATDKTDKKASGD